MLRLVFLLLPLFIWANNGWNALHKAVYEEDIQKVQHALETEDIDSTTTAGLSSLHMSVKKRDLAMVKFLVDQGANIDAQDNKGFSVLYYAVLQNNIPIAKYLLTHKANPNLKNNIGNAPMHNIAYNSRFEMLELFIFFGANLKIKNAYGMRPYDFAQRKGNKGMMAELSQYEHNLK
ncbi:ankyrin repeat domain-containing protein [Candidatus Marinarcus aquaticus]|uniref:Uncharacterized protein n=1 Tax=Candidatus Marinarcus aquaticus TaxID=2044504 RepID=A0A4V1LNW0_9BACT|nr:ankyrin repeat domain-containing protein [Candidatus Marinarcus aquaticus]RXJ56432.1 hypothetical protein CRV04_08425 [Candidatus Marinarcus aquaticus]